MPQLAIAEMVLKAAYALKIAITVKTAMAVAAVVQFVATLSASMAASKLLAPKVPSFNDASLGDRTQMVRSPVSARQIIYGQSRVSGTVVYISTTGTKNEFLHLVIALAGHEVEEIGDIYFNDELALTGAGSSATGRFATYAEIYKKLGSPTQTVQTDLKTATAGLTNGAWTDDHRLRGIAYIYVRLKWNEQVWTGGIPNISAVVKGKKVYDPRTATTSYSANAALCLRDYLTDSTYGMGMTSSEIDDTAFTVAANICDEDVEVKPVTVPPTYENRYEANGVLYTSSSPSENIGKLLSAMGGLVAYSGGMMVPYAAAYRIPTVTLTDTDFVGAISIQTRTSARDRVNGVKGVFVSEKSEWQPTDFPPATSATYLSQDNNVRYWRDVSLGLTTSSSCAQRIARIELRRARQEITMTSRFRLDAMQVRAGDTVMVTLDRFGWSQKVFEVVEWHFVSDGTPPQLMVEMTLRETASEVYDWSVTDEDGFNQAPTTTLPNPFSVSAPTNLTLTADGTTQLVQADGTALPRIKVAWSAPSNEFVQSGGQVVIEYKQGNSTTYLTWSKVGGDQVLDYISSDVRIGTSYDVRIFGESYFGIATSYVNGNITVAKDTTAPAIPTGLTAAVGTGKAVSLDWADNTEPDLSEYGVYRNTTGVTPTSVTINKIAEVRASRFVDTEVSIGTTYWYWINAYDALENVSGFSSSVTAVPTYVSGGSVDPTAPSQPAAPQYVSEGTYVASDGGSFARISLTAPPLSTNAIATDILYRRSGSNAWIVANQIDSSVSYLVSIDDLSCGVAYEFAARAISNFGVLSNVSTTIARTAPTPTTAPLPVVSASITQYSGGSSDYKAEPLLISGVLAFSARAAWSEPSDPSINQYEWILQAGATPVTPSVTATGRLTSDPTVVHGNLLLNATYFWVRSINRAGVKSDWVTDGVNLNTVWQIPAGTMTNQDADAVDITGGDLAQVVLSAVEITSLTVPLAIADGGTDSGTAAGARVNLLPSLASNAGKVLAVNTGATDVEWIAAGGGGGSGTVTSVQGTGTVDGLTLSGTVTTSGSLTLSGNVDVSSVAGTLPIGNGGTGATTDSGARTNLGLGTAATKDTTNMGNLKTGVITISTGSYLKFESGSVPKIDEGWGLSLDGDSTHPVRVQQALVLGSFGAGNTFTATRIYFAADRYLFDDGGVISWFDGSTTYALY